MFYEITYPAAEPMLQQERISQADAKPLDYSASVADQVAFEIHRASWCESHQRSVNLIRSALNELSNIPEFQLAVLEETHMQIKEGRRVRSHLQQVDPWSVDKSQYENGDRLYRLFVHGETV